MTQGHRTFRALGGVDPGQPAPAGPAAEALQAEFERLFAVKAGLLGEARAGRSPTGRHSSADQAKLRALVASVEGASRFAIRLGLLTPGEVRALWSQAMARGLYDGWDAEREGPPPGPPPATREAKDPALGREG
jgi:hypothetical protein